MALEVIRRSYASTQSVRADANFVKGHVTCGLQTRALPASASPVQVGFAQVTECDRAETGAGRTKRGLGGERCSKT